MPSENASVLLGVLAGKSQSLIEESLVKRQLQTPGKFSLCSLTLIPVWAYHYSTLSFLGCHWWGLIINILFIFPFHSKNKIYMQQSWILSFTYVMVINRPYFLRVFSLQKNWVEDTESHIPIYTHHSFLYSLTTCISVLPVLKLMRHYY